LLQDNNARHPKPLPTQKFVHDEVKEWEHPLDINLELEEKTPMLSAAVPEFGVHNTQIMSRKLFADIKCDIFRNVQKRWNDTLAGYVSKQLE